MATQLLTEDENLSQPQESPEPEMDVDMPNGQAVDEPLDDKDVNEDEEFEVKPPVKICCVCTKEKPNYKCARVGCGMPYCSIPCSKQHLENHAPDPVLPPKPAPQSPPPRRKLTKAEKREGLFGALAKSEKLQYLFTRYPRLPSQLMKISDAMQVPSDQDSRLPASLMAGLPGADKNTAWSNDKGIRNGKKMLRRMRDRSSTLNDEDSVALQEYTKLVRLLKEELEEEEMNDRAQAADEPESDMTRLLEQLLSANKT